MTNPHPQISDLDRAVVMLTHLEHDQFTAEFRAWLPDNMRVFRGFEREALSIAHRGIKHYSARTIIEVLRHHSALAENSDAGWKLNDRFTPYLARLFALLHPAHANLFEFREAKAAARERAAA